MDVLDPHVNQFDLVATDVDGTIANHAGQLTALTLNTFAQLTDGGVRTVVVTGRPVRRAAVLFRAGLRMPMLCNYGTVFLNPVTGDTRILAAFSTDELSELVATVRRMLPGVAFAVERTDGFRREERYRPRVDAGVEVDVAAGVESLFADDVVKLKVRCEDVGTDSMFDTLMPAVAGLGDMSSCGPSSGGQVEFSPRRFNKGAGLAWFAEQHGVIAERVVAFGDEVNDLPMLAWAGVGCAVASGHARALAVADRVVGAVDENGVATALREMFSHLFA
jgi:hypothetical protein